MNTVISIEPTELFTEAVKRFKKSNPAIVKRLEKFVQCKLNGSPIPNSYKDHACVGNLSGCRECHLAGNVLLVYKNKGRIIQLLGICSHDELYILRRKIERYIN